MTVWKVLISEQRKVGHGFRVDREFSRRTFDRPEKARSEARRLVDEHVPKFPWFPQGRTVARVSDDHYIVMVRGYTGSVFTFEVNVCEVLSTENRRATRPHDWVERPAAWPRITPSGEA